MRRVTAGAVTAAYISADAAGHWLSYLAAQPFFASMTLYVIVATAV